MEIDEIDMIRWSGLGVARFGKGNCQCMHGSVGILGRVKYGEEMELFCHCIFLRSLEKKVGVDLYTRTICQEVG